MVSLGVRREVDLGTIVVVLRAAEALVVSLVIVVGASIAGFSCLVRKVVSL